MTAITLPGFTRSATAGGLPLAQAFASGAGVRLTGSTSGTVDLFPSATVTTPYTLTLPAALGASDKLIQVSSTGVMSLVDAPSTVPAGTGTEIQYRNGSAFGAVAGSSWDGTTLAVPKLSATSTTANQLTVGYDATYKVTLDVSSAGVMTLAGYKPSGSNVAAGSAYIDVPQSTGNATPGSLIVRTTVAGTSGSTQQALADTLVISAGRIGIGAASATHTVSIGLAASGTANTATPLRVRTSGSYDGNIFRAESAESQFNLLLSAQNLAGSDVSYHFSVANGIAGVNGANLLTLRNNRIGVNTSGPDRACEINAADGNCLRLTYNDSNGSAANYVDFAVSSAGNLTITPSGGIAYLTSSLEPATDDTYYLGRNDDDTPKAWKGVILKDTTNGKYYRIEVISGVLTATDLTD